MSGSCEICFFHCVLFIPFHYIIIKNQIALIAWRYNGTIILIMQTHLLYQSFWRWSAMWCGTAFRSRRPVRNLTYGIDLVHISHGLKRWLSKFRTNGTTYQSDKPHQRFYDIYQKNKQGYQSSSEVCINYDKASTFQEYCSNKSTHIPAQLLTTTTDRPHSWGILECISRD